MAEQFYLIGKLGSSDGFQVKSLKLETTGTRNDDIEYFQGIDNQVVFKREFFIISRKNNRTYHTYVREGLSGERGASSLGFSYVYEDGFNVITKMLDLRNVMKEALEDLLQGNGFAIQSFDDPKVSTALMKIKSFTDKVEAKTLPRPINNIQLSPLNPNDLTNEKIWEMLKKSVNVEISEEIPTQLQIKDTEIKNLSLQNQTKQTLINTQGKDIENLRKENEKLRKENADRNTTIVKLNKDLEDAKKGNGKRDAKISSLLSEIKGLLSNDKPISGGQSRREPVKSKPDNRLSYINIGLSMLIVIILLLFNTCKGGGSETEEVQTLNEKITELNTQKDTLEKEKKELESQVEDLQKEVNEKDKEIIDLEEKNEKLKKEKKEQNKPKQDKKNTAKAKANKTEDNAEKSSGEQKK
ncbi:MAG: hypothetical protein U0L54_04140 [Bacteroidales bacterium]|nr:hypothetical protein [Bacteroidales bacterium]MEE1001082.1 hypothetical protein [Bacteroidales bacterium]